MNHRREEFVKKTVRAEENRKVVAQDGWRQSFHLMPPVGWLNDPNGLCQMNGVYHTFFQYSPDDPEGGFKTWGHYTSRDLLHWNYEGVAFYPDEEFDRDGVYSGSALIEDGVMHLFYTGNVKEPGEHDYIYSGRRADTVHVTSTDGLHFTEKKVVIKTEDYPAGYSCHIRDPKVWKAGNCYRMVQGARTREDEGRVLVFESKNLIDWKLARELKAEKDLGYMWECPDYMELGEQKILSICPQGVERGQNQFQNVYGSGYFKVAGNITGEYQLSDFEEWDYGFDFYAPQSFEDESGRRLFLGWMGLPDIDTEYRNPTVDRGWQHCMTMFRELVCEDGILYQRPAAEYKELRREETVIQLSEQEEAGCAMELEDLLGAPEAGQSKNGYEIRLERTMDGIKDVKVERTRAGIEVGCGDWKVTLAGGLELTYVSEQQEFQMRFTDVVLGAGRTMRRVKLNELKSMDIYVDSSSVEVYLNGGEKVMTTRFYPGSQNISCQVEAKNAKVKCWKLR